MASTDTHSLMMTLKIQFNICKSRVLNQIRKKRRKEILISLKFSKMYESTATRLIGGTSSCYWLTSHLRTMTVEKWFTATVLWEVIRSSVLKMIRIHLSRCIFLFTTNNVSLSVCVSVKGRLNAILIIILKKTKGDSGSNYVFFTGCTVKHK